MRSGKWTPRKDQKYWDEWLMAMLRTNAGMPAEMAKHRALSWISKDPESAIQAAASFAGWVGVVQGKPIDPRTIR